jgi:hypothetical protein
VLYDHALALAEQRATRLPGSARDELVSSVDERGGGQVTTFL